VDIKGRCKRDKILLCLHSFVLDYAIQPGLHRYNKFVILNLSINNTFSQSNPCCNFYDTGQELGIEGETFGIALGDIDNANSLYAHDLAVADMNNDWMPDIWAGNFSSSGGDHVFVQETPVFVYDTVYLCQGDSFFVGGAWQFAEGDFLENINWNTLSWYHLSEVWIDTSIMQSNDTLYALPDYMAYQWFNCETMEPVAGANDYYFVPGQSGIYLVKIEMEEYTVIHKLIKK